MPIYLISFFPHWGLLSVKISTLCGGGTVKNEGEADKKITKSLEEIVDFRSYENSIFSASLMIIYCF